jgi:hypothetical protein
MRRESWTRSSKRTGAAPLDRIEISITSEGQLAADKGVVYPMGPGRDPVERHPQSVLKV